MKRRGSPAIKYGSSGSVTETGAQQGKSSSTATIRRTEGNGQEKSSGRASAENVGKVDETGARRGKSSSTVTIRQTEGNSQEKSSGRARDTAARRRMSAEERKIRRPSWATRIPCLRMEAARQWRMFPTMRRDSTRREKHRTNFSTISWTRQNLSTGDICILAGLLTASELRWKKRA